MAITTKREDQRFRVTNITYSNRCGGTEIARNTIPSSGIGSLITRTAEFSRPKPNRLTVTSYTYTDAMNYAPRVAPCGRHAQGQYYRTGNLRHSHNTATHSTLNFSSNGDAAIALARARFTPSQFGETMVTSNQTFRMIANRGKALDRIARNLKAGNWKQLQQELKGDVPSSVTRLSPSTRLSRGWLELEFGWKPLLSDIYDGISFYRSKVIKGQRISNSANTRPGGFGPRRDGGSGSNHAWSRIDHHRGSNAKARFTGRVSNPTLRSLNQLGLSNPMLIAWQASPYSFVVDWISPISSVLAAMTYSAGLDQIEGHVITESGRLSKLNANCSLCGSNLYDNCTRTVIRAPSSGSFSYIGALWNPRASSLWHVGTSLALFASRFGNHRARRSIL